MPLRPHRQWQKRSPLPRLWLPSEVQGPLPVNQPDPGDPRERCLKIGSRLVYRPTECSGAGNSAGRLIFRAVLEDRESVGVQAYRNALALDQTLQQPEIAEAVLHKSCWQNSALITVPVASCWSTAKSRANCDPFSPSQLPPSRRSTFPSRQWPALPAPLALSRELRMAFGCVCV